MAREAQTSSGDESKQAVLNGKAHKSAAYADSEPAENIFLFWPNVIGMPTSGAQSAPLMMPLSFFVLCC